MKVGVRISIPVFLSCMAGALLMTLTAAETPVTDWPSYNRTPTAERYSPLDQINRTNVSRLKTLCTYDFKVDINFQTGPIVVGRTMYATTDNDTVAIDSETCQLKWSSREDGPTAGLRVKWDWGAVSVNPSVTYSIGNVYPAGSTTSIDVNGLRATLLLRYN